MSERVAAYARAVPAVSAATDLESVSTLSGFRVQWRELYAAQHLAKKTLQSYDYLWARYIEGELGSAQVDELTPLTLEQWKADLLAAGVGVESVKRSLVLLQGVLQRAVEWQYLASNPARFVRKPPSARRRAVRPVAPETIERMRAFLIANECPTDALLVCVLAYCGLRPGEALALTWGAVGARRVLVESCVSLGEVKGTKTGRIRSVQLIEPMADDFHRNREGHSDGDLIFAGRGELPWSEDAWRNWRRRTFARAAGSVGLVGVRPYDLRHSFVSLLIAEGRSVLDVARQAGHSPTMTLNVYGHVFDDFDPVDRTSAAQRVNDARNLVRQRRRAEGAR
jgi:integrase